VKVTEVRGQSQEQFSTAGRQGQEQSSNPVALEKSGAPEKKEADETAA